MFWIKPAKSHSLSIWKDLRNDNMSFSANGEKIPLLVDQPVQSLGRRYTADLSSKQMAVSVSSQLADGLSKIDQIALPGKFKVWCYQFILYYHLMWPLKLSDITSTTVQRMDSKAKNDIRKWLGLPRCHSDTALIDHNILKLPLKSISLGCKKTKVRHMFELRDSSHPYKTPRPKYIQGTSGM